MSKTKIHHTFMHSNTAGRKIKQPPDLHDNKLIMRMGKENDNLFVK